MTRAIPRSSPGAGKVSLEALDARFRASLDRYFSRRMRDRGEIEDLIQEVFLRLARRGSLDDVDKIGGYVFETASSVLTDRLRRKRSRFEADHEAFDGQRHGDVDFSPERVLLGKEALGRATAVLLELPERTRVVFVMRRLEGMRYLDIAARLGISVSAVEKHMTRAMTHLVQRLGEP
ncbi:sigma-70 family RNA polymerase sigma factor [Sphingomonas sp. BT-65]|uniref:RNA polymerase sigma factor n=1 Tax=Sphingomonas sp. BT-65 TaxID=2989821 RepID=UPI002236AEAD|nr:sigma-70 family RNA polymerase sigma factor [Sphingomonas sp. BT-65]MCW4462000.1 sigma-70 family RNA polymerase sigma factor [Sphingomonas sp. BT-65]